MSSVNVNDFIATVIHVGGGINRGIVTRDQVADALVSHDIYGPVIRDLANQTKRFKGDPTGYARNRVDWFTAGYSNDRNPHNYVTEIELLEGGRTASFRSRLSFNDVLDSKTLGDLWTSTLI